MYNADCQEGNEMQRLIWNPYLPELAILHCADMPN